MDEEGVGLGFVFQRLPSHWESSQGSDPSLSGSLAEAPHPQACNSALTFSLPP